MLATLESYLPLYASCLVFCLGATLLLLLRVPDMIPPSMRPPLLWGIFGGTMFFLLCTRQWLFAALLPFWMLKGKLVDEEEHTVPKAALVLVIAGGLGIVDTLGWAHALTRPMEHWISYPLLSSGLAGLMLVGVVRAIRFGF